MSAPRLLPLIEIDSGPTTDTSRVRINGVDVTDGLCRVEFAIDAEARVPTVVLTYCATKVAVQAHGEVKITERGTETAEQAAERISASIRKGARRAGKRFKL